MAETGPWHWDFIGDVLVLAGIAGAVVLAGHHNVKPSYPMQSPVKSLGTCVSIDANDAVLLKCGDTLYSYRKK